MNNICSLGQVLRTLVRLPLYVSFLRALRIALCVLLVALIVLGNIQAALIVAVFLGLSFAHLLRSDRRPALFDVLFALAALVGALGFVFGLFEEIVTCADTFFVQELPAVQQWSFTETDARRISQPVLGVVGQNSAPTFRERRDLLLAWLPRVEPFDVPGATQALS